MKLVNLVPLKELDINDPALVKYRASRTVNKADNPMDKPSKPTRDLTYAKKLKLDMLKAKRAEIMRDMENNPSVEPEGGPVADDYGDQLNKIDAAIAKLRGTGNMTYDQAIGRVPMNETTEKAWNAIDVSRKAEKEISNKEWNERTAKKLDMLKKLNDAGKFKKDFDDERLQGWVDQNYSWQKLSKQFKLNEMKEATPTVFDDESIEKLGDIISKYVKDPDDVNRELDRFDAGGFDNMSDMVTANLDRDPEYKAWYNKVHSIKEGSCGYGPNGMPGNTPGETQGMDADDRTRGMLRMLIQKEIAKLKEADPKEDPREDPDYDMDQHYMDYDLPEMTLDQVASELGYMSEETFADKYKKHHDTEKWLKTRKKGDMDETFDDRLKSMMGDDDFKKATSKDVPGLGDTVIDDKTNISTGRKTFMKMMMQFTDEPFLIETGLKLYDAWARGEGGLKPSRILKILQDTSN